MTTIEQALHIMLDGPSLACKNVFRESLYGDSAAGLCLDKLARDFFLLKTTIKAFIIMRSLI